MWHLSCIYYCCNVHAWFFMMLTHCIHMYLACFLQCLHAFMQLIPGYAHLHNSSFAVLQLHTYILSEITLSHIWAAYLSHNVEGCGIFCNCLTRKPASLHLIYFLYGIDVWCYVDCASVTIICVVFTLRFFAVHLNKRGGISRIDWLIDDKHNKS